MKIAGHPVHLMLIVFPLGLLATAVIFDIITLSTSDGKWSTIAWYIIAAGIIGGLLAAMLLRHVTPLPRRDVVNFCSARLQTARCLGDSGSSG
jgi:uncharacterized membrane protein